jgi:FkbM family methyltransferase
VGANIGETVDLFRAIGVKVIAIEPQQVCADYLRQKYHRDGQVVVVQKAVAVKEGPASMYACAANQLSTLSPDFKSALEDSGRFGNLPDFQEITITATTLELLIKEYGRPDFLKIDVEGFEHEVVASLKTPVPFICFEYTFPESRHSFELCLKHLEGLGPAQYNISDHDFKSFVFPEWGSAKELEEWLHRETPNRPCGNIYVKYPCA